MNVNVILIEVLLLAAPLFSQQPRPVDPIVDQGELKWFTLAETPAQARALLGEPAQVSDLGPDLVSWQYQIGVADTHDMSHYLVFRKSTGRLISVTRNYDDDRNVDQWFPVKESATHYWPDPEKREYSVRVRSLSGGRVLMAMGVSKPGDPTSQIVLMLGSELRNFYPWLELQLTAKAPRQR